MLRSMVPVIALDAVWLGEKTVLGLCDKLTRFDAPRLY
jgi:hypothetical protein